MGVWTRMISWISSRSSPAFALDSRRTHTCVYFGPLAQPRRRRTKARSGIPRPARLAGGRMRPMHTPSAKVGILASRARAFKPNARSADVGEHPAGGLDGFAGRVSAHDGAAEDLQMVAEALQLFAIGGLVAPGRVVDVDEVDLHGRVADELLERHRVLVPRVEALHHDVGEHGPGAPREGVFAHGGHELRK